MTLSIIIVNYNVKLLLEQCLQSVTKAIDNIEAEVFVVDNASTDNSIEYLKPIFPSFNFLVNRVNEGFAKANNKALVIARGKYILFLNPDTIVPDDCFSKSINFLKEHSSAGALGVKMLNQNNHFLKESKRGFPTPLASFWKLSGISNLFPQSAFFSRYYLGHLDNDSIHEVDVLSGAFMLVKKEVLDKTGGFDERFFMYAEDIDLSYRIIQSGYKNYYFPGTTILHYKGASTTKDFKYVKLFYKAMSQFAEKYYGRNAFTYLLNTAIGIRGGIEALKQLVKKK